MTTPGVCPYKNTDHLEPGANFKGKIGAQHYNALGRRPGIQRVCNHFYHQAFSEPVLSCLFPMQDDVHAKTLTLYILNSMGVSDEYIKWRKSLGVVKIVHDQSLDNPSRLDAPKGAGYPGKGYTVTQRDMWKNAFMRSCREVGKLSGPLLDDMAEWVDVEMEPYGPFEPDREE
eukprot:PhM_4_TR1067/c0_g1_i1/m.83423